MLCQEPGQLDRADSQDGYEKRVQGWVRQRRQRTGERKLLFCFVERKEQLMCLQKNAS